MLDAGGFDSMSEADVRSIVAVFVLPRSPITLAFCSLTIVLGLPLFLPPVVASPFAVLPQK